MVVIYLGWDRAAWVRAAAWWLKTYPNSLLPTASGQGLEVLQQRYDEAHDPPPDPAGAWVASALRSVSVEYFV